MGIVVIGSVFVDIKGYPNNNYIPAGRNAGRVEQVHGGVCRNVVENIANVELRPVFVSLVDESGTGTDVLEKLNKHRVDTRWCRRTPDGMGTWLAVFNNDGDVVASISKRPDLTPIADVLRAHGDEIFAPADAIIVEFDIEKDTLKLILQLAKKHGKKVYGVISNMSIAVERRDLIKRLACLVCNVQEAGILFSGEYEGLTAQEMAEKLPTLIANAHIPAMVVTMGGQGAVYASMNGEKGVCPAQKVHVRDTTGAGDSFFSGVAIGLTYGKTLAESCVIGTRLAASVITTTDNVCPRFLPKELGLDVEVRD